MLFTMDSQPPLPRPGRGRAVAGALAALALLGWRAAACPLERLWRDWVAILAVFAFFLAVVPSPPRIRHAVAVVLLLALVAIYLSGQMPNILAAWDLLP